MSVGGAWWLPVRWYLVGKRNADAEVSTPKYMNTM